MRHEIAHSIMGDQDLLEMITPTSTSICKAIFQRLFEMMQPILRSIYKAIIQRLDLLEMIPPLAISKSICKAMFPRLDLLEMITPIPTSICKAMFQRLREFLGVEWKASWRCWANIQWFGV